MAEIPAGPLRCSCERVSEHFGIETDIDINTAVADAEVTAFIDALQDPDTADAWRRLAAWAVSSSKARVRRIRANAEAGYFTPDPPSRAPQAGGGRPAHRQGAAPRLPASKRRSPTGLQDTELKKRRAAADLVRDIVFQARDASDLYSEIPTEALQAAKWSQLFQDTLSGGGVHAGFEHRTLARAAKVWHTWANWLGQHAPSGDPFRPTVVHLHGFLQDATRRGPTAAWGLYQAFAWLRRHAGLRLPLDAAVVRPFARQRAGHQPQQQEPLKLLAFQVLLKTLADPTTPAWKRCGAALVARVLLSCLRWAHVERAVEVQSEGTARTQVWSVARGKAAGRAGFKTSVPTHLAPHLPLDPHIALLIEHVSEDDRIRMVPGHHHRP